MNLINKILASLEWGEYAWMIYYTEYRLKKVHKHLGMKYIQHNGKEYVLKEEHKLYVLSDELYSDSTWEAYH